MIAASLNSALGRGGLLLMLAASVIGALTVVLGIRRKRPAHAAAGAPVRLARMRRARCSP